MAFTGDEGGMIDPKTAQAMIDSYRKDLAPNQTRSVFVGINNLNAILAQGGVGIRVFFGRDGTGQNTVIITAVTGDEKTMAPLDGSKTDGLILDNNKNCPPYCPPVD